MKNKVLLPIFFTWALNILLLFKTNKKVFFYLLRSKKLNIK